MLSCLTFCQDLARTESTPATALCICGQLALVGLLSQVPDRLVDASRLRLCHTSFTESGLVGSRIMQSGGRLPQPRDNND